ncbi:MAG: hypothetical protein WC073_10525 [Sterolibacterium sp.]
MKSLRATLLAITFASGVLAGNPVWAEHRYGHFDVGHDRGHGRGYDRGEGRHVANVANIANDERGHHHDYWGVVLGLLVGSAIFLAATEPKPVIYPPAVVAYPSPPVVYVPPQPSVATYAIPAWQYYCAQPAGYYPYVTQCAVGWRKVAPQ